MEKKKIVIIGPESTGKSTLSQDLAGALQTVWVPEYARSYLEGLGREYTEADLLQIARGQLSLEDTLTATAKDYLVCDTDLYVLKVWSEHSYGRCDTDLLRWIAERRYDLYLLTYIDIDWVDDPLREHPQPEMRKYFYNVYKDIVTNSSVPWLEVRGTRDERLAQALKGVESLSDMRGDV